MGEVWERYGDLSTGGSATGLKKFEVKTNNENLKELENLETIK